MLFFSYALTILGNNWSVYKNKLYLNLTYGLLIKIKHILVHVSIIYNKYIYNFYFTIHLVIQSNHFINLYITILLTVGTNEVKDYWFFIMHSSPLIKKKKKNNKGSF